MTRSLEQAAFASFKELGAADRRLVMKWRDLTRCDWMTALINSGVLTRERRVHPDQAWRDAEDERFEAMLLEREERLRPASDPLKQRRHAAEHEASHVIVFTSLGVRVDVAAIGADGSGSCWSLTAAVEGVAREVRAAGLLAPKVWIGEFRADRFLEGSTGCETDQRGAIDATGGDRWNLQMATGRAREILRERHDEVIKLADKIDHEGCVAFP